MLNQTNFPSAGCTVMQKIIPFLILIQLLSACTENKTEDAATEPSAIVEQERLLQDSLDKMKRDFEEKASIEKQEAYERGINKIKESGLLEAAKKEGDKAPDFTLRNAVGKEVNLYEELKKGPVILTWYRGGWCPYCNVQLHYLQEKLPEIQQQGGQVIAMTPEKPDKSLTTSEKNALKFNVLSDLNNDIAREYGLVFKLDEEVSRLYKESFSLEEYNNTDSDELPVSASYVIDQDGTITYAYLDADYRNRAEPATLIAELKKLK